MKNVFLIMPPLYKNVNILILSLKRWENPSNLKLELKIIFLQDTILSSRNFPLINE